MSYLERTRLNTHRRYIMADRTLLAWFKREEIMSADQQQKLKKYYEERGYSAPDVALAVVGAGLVNAVALLAIKEPFTFWNTIVGFFILCILQTFHPAPFSRRFLKIAFATIWSFSFLSAIGVLFNIAFARLGGSFPNTSAECVIPFPSSFFQGLCKPSDTTFTPFNAYDLSYFVTWIVISIIVYWFFFLRGKKKSTKSAFPQDQLKSEQKHNSK